MFSLVSVTCTYYIEKKCESKGLYLNNIVKCDIWLEIIMCSSSSCILYNWESVI